jgi:membrane fusion protein (multidrug efflux system)
VQDIQGLSQLSVVGPDGKVEVRPVQKGPLWGTLQVISKGVNAGERVIVEGFQKARPGMQVDAQPAPPAIAGAPPAHAPPPPPPTSAAASSTAASAPAAEAKQ